MSHELIKVGVLPNDGLGDPLRVAFDKINNNFTTLFSTTDLVPDAIVTGGKPNEGTGDTLKVAFGKLNKNFAALYALEPTVKPVVFSLNEPLRMTFEKINSSFYSLFAARDPNTPTVVAVVEEPKSEPNIATDASFVGNINITNYNFYVNQQAKAKQPVPHLAIPDPAPELQQVIAYGNQEWINVGAQPNDGTGDPLRTAFQKINNNFSNLFFTTTNTTVTYTTGVVANQVIYEIPTSQFTQGSFQIKSSDTTTNSSQDITLTAQLANDKSAVKFTGYGTTFFGSYLTRYDMDVSGGNVRVLVNPILDTVIQHFIASQVTFISSTTIGLDIELNGYPPGSMMVTEGGYILETET